RYAARGRRACPPTCGYRARRSRAGGWLARRSRQHRIYACGMASSPYTDLDRPPLHEAALRRALVVPGGLWTELRVVTEAGSPNADLAARARDGAPEGLVLVAERQPAGRGRLGREWRSPARAGIAVSVLLRPGAADEPRPAVPPARLGWLPLL